MTQGDLQVEIKRTEGREGRRKGRSHARDNRQLNKNRMQTT